MNRLAVSLCLASAIVSSVITSLIWSAKDQPEFVAGSVEEMRPAPEISEEALQILQDKITSQSQQIHDLQNQLAGQANVETRVVKESTDPSRKSYMDQLQEEDPERHQRILNKLKETNEQTAQALADSAEFLFNLDMSLMTPEQGGNHQHLLSLIEASWEELDRMAETPQGPEAEDARTKLHQNVMAMHNAYKTERKIALEQYFQWQGYTAEQALAMRDGIEEVYTKTEPANLLPGTQFVGENMMISIKGMEDTDASQGISIDLGGLSSLGESQPKGDSQ